MSDEKELTHGFEIHGGDHDRALKYMMSHMNHEQVKDMVHRAQSGHGADFMVTHNSEKSNYKLVNEDGKLRIHSVSH